MGTSEKAQGKPQRISKEMGIKKRYREKGLGRESQRDIERWKERKEEEEEKKKRGRECRDQQENKKDK